MECWPDLLVVKPFLIAKVRLELLLRGTRILPSDELRRADYSQVCYQILPVKSFFNCSFYPRVINLGLYREVDEMKEAIIWNKTKKRCDANI